MSETLHIIVPTIRFSPVAQDIFKYLIGVVQEASDIHLTIADGQEDDGKRDWILRKADRIAKDGKFTYIGLKDATQRLTLASARESDWIVSVADDDPLSVNLIRAFQSAIQGASQDVAAISPHAYISYSGSQVNLFPLQDLTEQTQKGRLDSLYRQAHLNGILTWSVLRRQFFLDWMGFVREKPLWPTYADQLLVSYLAMKGKFVTTGEDCFIGKDERDWHDPVRAIVKDSGSYANKFSTLFHEIFWVSDLFTLLGQHGLEDEAWPSLTFRAAALMIGEASVFENRVRVLDIERSIHTENAHSLVNELARHANSLSGATVTEHGQFLAQVQAIAQQLSANGAVP